MNKGYLNIKFDEPYDPNKLIINFYKQINECLELAEDGDNI